VINKQYEKDSNGVVLNTDTTEFERYKLKRLKSIQTKTLEQRVQYLEKELTRLKKQLEN
jgi:C4-dicarboxylate-specific signal transduction histidine kinase